jgi:hypothetical protein
MHRLAWNVVIPVTVTFAGALFAAGMPGWARSADRVTASTATITVTATGRDGQPSDVGEDAVAAPLFGAPLAQYRADAQGVLTVPPGRYLLAVDITSDAAPPASSLTDTLAGRIITVRHSTTVHFDARQGKPMTLHLREPGVQAETATAGVCYGTGQVAEGMVSVADPISTPVYAIPFKYKHMSFGYAGNWRGPKGMPYVASGISTGGIPAKPDFTFRASGIAKLTFQVTAGAVSGNDGLWSVQQVTGCRLGRLDAARLIGIPGRHSQFVSAGPWQVRFNAFDGSNQSVTQVNVRLRGGRSFVQRLEGAVVTPPPGLAPQYGDTGHGSVSMLLNDLFTGTDRGFLCCADGVLRLSTGGKKIDVMSFNMHNYYFMTKLHHTGQYKLTIDVRRAPSPPGIAAAVLSLREHLTWRFKVTSSDLGTPGTFAPVSVTTMAAGGLNADNDAAPNGHTQLRVRVWPARHGREFRLKTVRLQVSFDSGANWRSIALSQKGGYWLAQIPDPASGFVSLRSTVTDVQGDSSVETIYRGYGIS